MRHSVIVILLLIFSLPLQAQHGNEWINFSQPYYKISTAQDAIYRLSYSNLVAAGVPPVIDPRSIRIYHRGVEQAIVVAGESDGVLNNADYVEFFGKRNDGTTDRELYVNPTFQPHAYYNLYSDTTHYFLTFGSGEGQRMQLVSESSAALPAENFVWDEKLLILSEYYSPGRDYGSGNSSIQQTYFDNGEGWMGNIIHKDQTRDHLISGIANTYQSGPAPTLEILLTGVAIMAHGVEIYAGPRLLNTITFHGYDSYTHTQALQWSDISVDGSVTIKVRVIGASSGADRISVGYVKVRYPQQVDIDNSTNKIFFLNENTGAKSFIRIADAPAETKIYDITDPNSVRRINTIATGTLDAVVTETSETRSILANSTPLVPGIRPVSFRQIDPSQHDYIIITHPSLRRPASGYIDPVKAYGEYRSLEVGGGYDTLIVNIDQLYNQFSFGEQTPLAIYRFMKYLYSVNPPKYLFLIGKGLDIDHRYYRSPNIFTTYKDLVPTAGFPASDMAFTAGLEGSAYVPAVATGRITAITAQDVASYLNKIKKMEELPFNDLRRKNILHLSGGVYDNEPQQFKAYLEQFASIAESNYLGGRVTAVAKKDNDQRVINVAEQVNAGLNLITFFGHSASTATDFDIGYVTDPLLNYNNEIFPLLMMNGCYSGSVFLNRSIFGENWVNTPERGAIGLIAHSHLAFAPLLRNYGSLFYFLAYGNAEFINKGMGDIQKETAKEFIRLYLSNPNNIAQVQQMVMLGDPAYRLFGAGKPDYAINAEEISIESFNGEPITAFLDSLKLNIHVKNYGIATSQNLKVSVTRSFSDGTTEFYDSTFSAVLYSDTLRFKIRGDKEKGFGQNGFTVIVDFDETVNELNENNNQVEFAAFIPLSRTQNLFPDNFAIVNTTTTNLTFQFTDALSDKRQFILEVDTVNTFDSDYKKQYELQGSVIGTRQLALLEQDSLTYYWRTRLKDPLENESSEWDLSSFTYIEDGPEGWAQIHFQQFEGNKFAQLVDDPTARRIEFEETVTSISVRTYGSAAGKPVDSVSFTIKGAEYNLYSNSEGVFGCRNNTINLIAFDKQSTQPYPGVYLTWADMLYTYGGKRLICGREPYVINSYRSDELVMGNDADIIRYINNIPAGDSVVLFNIGDAGYANWPVAARTKLGEIGISISQIDNLEPGAPVVIFARKGAAAGSARVVTSDGGIANQQRLKFSGTITGRPTSGAMSSSVIGPAKEWHELRIRVTEKEMQDEAFFDIYGVKSSGQQQLLLTDVSDDVSLSEIDASVFPFLRIHFKSEDVTLVTSPQLRNWIVTYAPVAEGLSLYGGTLEEQVLQEGQSLTETFKFVNISNTTFTDSLTVNYDVVNPTTHAKTRKSKRIKAPLPSDTTQFQLTFATVGQDGINDVEVFVNPRIEMEQRYDNNTISLRNLINVQTDPNSPVLDVLFDGRHIASKDLVSSSPEIKITLWDENPFLLKTDTLGIKIALASPCVEDDCVLKPIYFSRADVDWKPATENSEFTILFTPATLIDGTHKLRVEASDANGNESDIAPYEIEFQVKSEPSITISSPYPNPFQYQAAFEYVLTGDDFPERLVLQIFSSRGEIVHEITQTVNAPRVGRNEIFWDGRDLNQHSIPNGVYLFRFTLHFSDREITRSGRIAVIR